MLQPDALPALSDSLVEVCQIQRNICTVSPVNLPVSLTCLTSQKSKLYIASVAKMSMSRTRAQP